MQYMDPSYFVKLFSLLAFSLGKPHHLALIIYSSDSQPVDHGKILTCQGHEKFLIGQSRLFSFLLCACAKVVPMEKLYSRWAVDPVFAL